VRAFREVAAVQREGALRHAARVLRALKWRTSYVRPTRDSVVSDDSIAQYLRDFWSVS
jgi:hypothetical protein